MLQIQSVQDRIARIEVIKETEKVMQGTLPKCYNCGKFGHGRESCEQRRPSCYKCGQVGHLKFQCPRLSNKHNSGDVRQTKGN